MNAVPPLGEGFPDQTRERDIRLLPPEGPDGPFFVVDTGRQPDAATLYAILKNRMAEPEDLSQALVLGAIKEAGLLPPANDAQGGREILITLVVWANEYYQQNNFRNDPSKLRELYGSTEEYDACPLLDVFNELRAMAPMYDSFILEADRIARILIANESDRLPEIN